MTVKQLVERLNKYINAGQGNLEVIARGSFFIKNEEHEKYLIYLNGVEYQSGDIELAFSDKELAE